MCRKECLNWGQTYLNPRLSDVTGNNYPRVHDRWRPNIGNVRIIHVLRPKMRGLRSLPAE